MATPRTIRGSGFSLRLDHCIDLLVDRKTLDFGPNPWEIVAAAMFLETRRKFTPAIEACPCGRCPERLRDSYGTSFYCSHCYDPADDAGELSLLAAVHEDEITAVETWNMRVRLYRGEAA